MATKPVKLLFLFARSLRICFTACQCVSKYGLARCEYKGVDVFIRLGNFKLLA